MQCEILLFSADFARDEKRARFFLSSRSAQLKISEKRREISKLLKIWILKKYWHTVFSNTVQIFVGRSPFPPTTRICTALRTGVKRKSHPRSSLLLTQFPTATLHSRASICSLPVFAGSIKLSTLVSFQDFKTILKLHLA